MLGVVQLGVEPCFSTSFLTGLQGQPKFSRAGAFPKSNMKVKVQRITERIPGRVICVGDVHGCTTELRTLLRALRFSNHATRSNPTLLSPSPPSDTVSCEDGGAEVELLHRPDDVGGVVGLPHSLQGQSDVFITTNPEMVDDLCVYVGDLVNRGPDSYGVVRLLQAIGAVGVMGNHELKLMDMAERIRSGEGCPKKAKKQQLYSLAANCPPDILVFLESLPHIICFDAYRLIVVHGGIDPSLPLEEQRVEAVTQMRNIMPRVEYEELMRRTSRPGPEHVALSKSAAFVTLEKPTLGEAWGAVWSRKVCQLLHQQRSKTSHFACAASGPAIDGGSDCSSAAPSEANASMPDTGVREADGTSGLLACAEYEEMTVVFGHDASRNLQIRPYLYGIDTGCSRGGTLTALVMPQRGLMSVPGWVNTTQLTSKV